MIEIEIIGVVIKPVQFIPAVNNLIGGENSWTGSDAHHTLVLGPGDHVMARNTVSIHITLCCFCMPHDDQHLP